MNHSITTPAAGGKQQRKALGRSEKKATEQQPDSFKDKASAEKVVEIGPDMTDQPIKGIDPSQQRGSR